MRFPRVKIPKAPVKLTGNNAIDWGLLAYAIFVAPVTPWPDPW